VFDLGVHTSTRTIWEDSSLEASTLKRHVGRSSVNLNRNMVMTMMPKSTHRVTFLFRYGSRILAVEQVKQAEQVSQLTGL